MRESFEQSALKEQIPIIDTIEIAAGNFSLVREMERIAGKQEEKIDFGENVIITDINEDDLRCSREDFEYDQEHGVIPSSDRNFAILDAAKMPFANNSVRKILCANFFSSQLAMGVGAWARPGVSKIERFLQEIHRVLVPGGFLVIHDTLSPNISDQIIEHGYFSKGFEDVSDAEMTILGVSSKFISQIENKHGEKNIRGIRVFKKI